MSASNTPTISSEWVSIGRASQLLGVNPATLRQWTAAGKLHAYRTPGGHRRFRRAELAAIAQQGEQTTEPGFAETLIEQLRQRYRALTQEAPAHQSWIADLDQQLRRRFHELGDALLARLGVYITASPPRHRRQALEAARAIACQYGRLCREAGIETPQAIGAYLLFRRPVLEVLARTLSSHPELGGQLSRLMRDAERFMDQVLSGIAEATASERNGGETPNHHES